MNAISKETPWSKEWREQALTRFEAKGLPGTRDEQWKYTQFPDLKKFKSVGSAADADLSGLDAYFLKDAWVLVLVDGFFKPKLSRLEGLPEGLKICGIADALKQEKNQSCLGRTLKHENHGFIDFNQAFFTDGLFVEVAENLELAKPLQFIHYSSAELGQSVTRNLLSLGNHSKLQWIETYAGAHAKSYLTVSMTEALIGEGASLSTDKFQDESIQAYHFAGLYVSQQKNASFSQNNIAFGARMARNEIHASLDQGASCALNGLFLAKGRQHLDTHSLIDHWAPNGQSKEHYRGVLAEKSRGVFQGRIVVHPDAQKTQSEMSNRNLLLSDDAEIDTQPQLEILADDVKCSHGVTIGQLDAESLFFLESRGLDPESARNMLTFAFANAMVEKIELKSLRDQVQDRLLDLLPQADIRRDL